MSRNEVVKEKTKEEMKNKANVNKQTMETKRKQLVGLLGVFGLFLGTSVFLEFTPGMIIWDNFEMFAVDMFTLFPPAFVLVGLFMVWVDRKTIEKYFGEASGAMGNVMAILLACTTLYPFVVVLPMAAGLSKKGAKLSIMLTYLGASAICRIPMSIFEASFLGIKFTIIRYVVSLPLIVLTSILIEKLFGSEVIQLKLETEG